MYWVVIETFETAYQGGEAERPRGPPRPAARRRAEFLDERAVVRPIWRAVVHREHDAIEGAPKCVVREPRRERLGHMVRIVAEDAAAPCPEEEAPVAVRRGHREHLARARGEGLLDHGA